MLTRRLFSKTCDDSINLIIEKYCAAYDVLSAASDFSPRNAAINTALSELVGILSLHVSEEDSNRLLAHPAIGDRQCRMWNYLSRAEAAMELYFGGALCRDTYRQFMYYRNYEMLVDAELEQIPGLFQDRTTDRGIGFVGAGAMPLTAILMAQRTGQTVTCLDCDPQAVKIGREFILRCGLSAGVRYRLQAGESYDYSDDSTIFIASLVPDKDAVIERILNSTQDGRQKTIAVRSVEGVHALLYRPVDETIPNARGVFFNRRSRTTPEIINTTLFADIYPAAVSEFGEIGNVLQKP